MTAPNITGPESGLLGLKSVAEFQHDPLSFLTGLAHQYGDIVHFKFGTEDIYLLAHPDYAREVLVKQSHKVTKWKRFRQVNGKIARHNLIILEGEDWKQARKLTAPAFHTQRIKKYLEIMSRHARLEATDWQDGEVYDMNLTMNRITMGVIGEILFQIPDIERDAVELVNALETLVEMIMVEASAAMPLPNWVPTPRNIQENRALKYSKEFIMKIIQERRKTGIDQGDVLSALLHAVDEDNGQRLTDTEVRDMCLSLFNAGRETTARALSWELYMLARYPEVQTRVYEEVMAVITGDSPDLQDLEALPYNTQVLQETLRLYPPAWSLFVRAVNEPIQLGDYTIPAGSLIYMSPYVFQHDPRWWEDPDLFKPERFSEGWKDRTQPYAYLPFGGGARVCIGSHLAEMEAKVILAILVKHYRFELAEPGQEVGAKASVTLKPEPGLFLRVYQR